jgi:hypothetical protein
MGAMQVKIRSSAACAFVSPCNNSSFLFVFSGPFNRSWERRWKRILKPCELSASRVAFSAAIVTPAPQQRELAASAAGIGKALQQHCQWKSRQQQLEWQRRSIGCIVLGAFCILLDALALQHVPPVC